MGKLLDQVLEIQKSNINLDLSESNINKNIESINNKILEAARNSSTDIFYISFESADSEYTYTTATLLSTYDRYTYYVNHKISVDFIINKLAEYYTSEGFNVESNAHRMYISWRDKLSK